MVLGQKGITKSLHYLDDFILVAEDMWEAESQKQVLVSVFNSPVVIKIGRLKLLTFLGIGLTQLLSSCVSWRANLVVELEDMVGRNGIKGVAESNWPATACGQSGAPWV